MENKDQNGKVPIPKSEIQNPNSNDSEFRIPNSSILVIDDDPVFLRMLERVLGEAGSQVSSAKDGEQGLTLFKAHAFDLVITDMKMPKMNGLQVVNRFKKIKPDIEIIVVTGHANLDNAIEVLSGDLAYGYLLKPVQMNELLMTVNRALERSIFKKENQRLINELKMAKEELEWALKDTSSKLAYTETLYQSIVEDQTELICRFLPDTTLTFVNQSYCRFFGKSEKELLGKPFIQFIPEDDREFIQKQIAALNKDNPTALYTHQVSGPEGTIHYQQWCDRALFDPTGNIIEYQSVGTDINELIESQKRYQILFEHSPISIWEEDFSNVKARFDQLRKMGVQDFNIYSDDHPDEVSNCAALVQITDINETSVRMFGADQKEDIPKYLPNYFIDESMSVFRGELIILWEGKTNFESEITIRTPAGDLKNLYLTLSVVPGYEKTWKKVLVSFIDITEKKQIEKELANSLIVMDDLNKIVLEQNENTVIANRLLSDLSKSDSILEAMQIISQTLLNDLGCEHHLILINESDKEAVKHIVGAGEFEGVGQSDLMGSNEKIQNLISTRRNLLGKKSNLSDIDPLKHIHLNCLIISIKGKNRNLGVLIVKDPGSERRDFFNIIINQSAVIIENLMLYNQMNMVNQELTATNQKLKDLDQKKSDFLNMVAHDLRTPLTSIRSYSDLLLMYKDEPFETQEEFLTTINRESVRLTSLINDFLDLTRIESGTFQYKKDLFNIKEIIDHFHSVYLGDTKRRNISFTKEIKTDLPEVLGDKDRISQVVANILSNAIKFTPNGGKISVSAELKTDQPHSEIQIIAADTGPGIDPKYHQKIFDKFSQVEDKNIKAKGGTGLGLAIAHEVVSYHGGRIWVESEPGHGAVFFFTLPINPKRKYTHAK